MAAVVQLAKLTGWKAYHTFDSRRSEPGFPDCLFIHKEKKRGIAWELKAQGGRVTPAQLEWLAAFEAAGFETGLLYPANWDYIERELTR